jgi:hypothetical protein
MVPSKQTVSIGKGGETVNWRKRGRPVPSPPAGCKRIEFAAEYVCGKYPEIRSFPRHKTVGIHIQISLNNQIMDAVIRAVIEHTDGLRPQVDFGHEQTALLHEWQVVKE